MDDLKIAVTSEAMYARRAHWNVRLTARKCCREHGTTCPDCRMHDAIDPRWRVRLRDLRDALRAWYRG